MRRLLMMLPIVALAFAGVVPSGARAAYPTEDTPIVIGCTATGGYEDTAEGPIWKHQNVRVQTPAGPYKACLTWSPDTAQSPEPPSFDDPTDPVEVFDDLFFWAFFEGQNSQPLAHTSVRDWNLAGDFACGEGTLTKAPNQITRIIYSHTGVGGHDWRFNSDLAVDFTDGVGDVSGSVENRSTGEIRDVTGTIVIEDGAAVGQCDDSAGAANVALRLVLAPQN